MKLLIAALLFICNVTARSEDYRSSIYRAYLEGRMDRWKVTMDAMAKEVERTGDLPLMYELTETQYGYIGYCLSMDQKTEAKSTLDQAEKQVEILLEKMGEDPRVYSLKGAFYGFRIQLQPLRAPFFGKLSEEANQRALELGPGEPQAWMEKANIAYYKPAIFGGSKGEAVPLYEKAIRLYEASPDRIRENWIYLNCLAGLGVAYEETDQPEKAGAVYRKLLQMEPDFKWVRDELYPRFREKHSGL
jgi:tetratricopeptide (TPR) repeat protein